VVDDHNPSSVCSVDLVDKHVRPILVDVVSNNDTVPLQVLYELGSFAAGRRTHIEHLHPRLNIQNQGWEHTDKFLTCHKPSFGSILKPLM
jgi:hypothetical protein